jgi:hypothetical protein
MTPQPWRSRLRGRLLMLRHARGETVAAVAGIDKRSIRTVNKVLKHWSGKQTTATRPRTGRPKQPTRASKCAHGDRTAM